MIAIIVLHRSAGLIAALKLAEMEALIMLSNGLTLDVDLHACEIFLTELTGSRRLLNHYNRGEKMFCAAHPRAVFVFEFPRYSVVRELQLVVRMAIVVRCKIRRGSKDDVSQVLLCPAHEPIFAVAVGKLEIVRAVRLGLALDLNLQIVKFASRGIGDRRFALDIEHDGRAADGSPLAVLILEVDSHTPRTAVSMRGIIVYALEILNKQIGVNKHFLKIRGFGITKDAISGINRIAKIAESVRFFMTRNRLALDGDVADQRRIVPNQRNLARDGNRSLFFHFPFAVCRIKDKFARDGGSLPVIQSVILISAEIIIVVKYRSCLDIDSCMTMIFTQISHGGIRQPCQIHDTAV